MYRSARCCALRTGNRGAGRLRARRWPRARRRLARLCGACVLGALALPACFDPNLAHKRCGANAACPSPPNESLCIEEFCEFMRISRATYYRMLHAGAGPRLTLIFGAVRIRKDDALSWLDDQPQVEPEPVTADQPRPRHLRAPKPAKKKAPPKKANVPRLFEPAPPKPGRKVKEPT